MAKKETTKINPFQYAEDMAEIKHFLHSSIAEAEAKKHCRYSRSQQLDAVCKSAYVVARTIQDDAQKCEEYSGLLKNMGKKFLQLAHELDARVEFLRGHNTPRPGELRVPDEAVK